jgi:hypothetical protein
MLIGFRLNLSAAFCKKRATRLLETRLQTPVTPSERHLERNQMVPGRPGVMGAALEPSGFSPGVSQRELQEFEGEFAKVELHASCSNNITLSTVLYFDQIFLLKTRNAY